MQTILRMIYPPQCLMCAEMVEFHFGLCGACWKDLPFIRGTACRSCGVPLPGAADEAAQCDDCMSVARPWRRGAAALLYQGTARKIVLRLKHGDRTDLARPAAGWMQQVLPNIDPDQVIVPVPLHRARFLKRRYNQAALLARALSRLNRAQYVPDALQRINATPPMERVNRQERYALMHKAIRPHPKNGPLLDGRSVLLVDDVMTSGATLAAATEACMIAGADHVDVLTLARVAKDR